jgi:hypothetical protein
MGPNEHHGLGRPSPRSSFIGHPGATFFSGFILKEPGLKKPVSSGLLYGFVPRTKGALK